MPSQLVLDVRELNRGWCTPDPSPTRSSNGPPHCGASSCEVTVVPEIPDEDARGSNLDQFERAADTACTGAGPNKQGSPASGLQLKPYIDDHELMEASTPRGHDQEARGTSSAADALPPVAREGATLDAAWARIRTPSPEPRTYAPRALPAWSQGMPENRPPQWTSFRQHVLSPVAWAGATPHVAWTRIRTPSPEARTLAPHAPSTWSQGMPENKPPQRIPLREPSAEPTPPPPPAPVVAAAQRGRARAKESKAAMANQKWPSPGCTGMLSVGPSGMGVLSVGSVGHPYTCQDPCKFVHKNRGCKDGADCNRCHVCLWNRYDASRAASIKQ